jgi:hypothetical protein
MSHYTDIGFTGAHSCVSVTGGTSLMSELILHFVRMLFGFSEASRYCTGKSYLGKER